MKQLWAYPSMTLAGLQTEIMRLRLKACLLFPQQLGNLKGQLQALLGV